MPAMPSGSYASQGPSCFDRIKLGAIMGFSVGCSVGLLFGGFMGIRAGFRGKELLVAVGKNMAQSGGTFGTFMAIGSGIRC